MKGIISVTIAAALALGACAAPEPVERETIVETRARIEAIDRETREVVLRDLATDETVTVLAGPELRRLDEVEVGDDVLIGYRETVSVRMAGPADESVTEIADATRRAPDEMDPAIVEATALTTVVEIVSYDPEIALATFTTPDGDTLSTVVEPGMRDFAEGLDPGDRVAVAISEAVAVRLEPAAE